MSSSSQKTFLNTGQKKKKRRKSTKYTVAVIDETISKQWKAPKKLGLTMLAPKLAQKWSIINTVIEYFQTTTP